MKSPAKCAKCAGPGKTKLYRAELPPGVPEARCKKQGKLWAIPCCPRHQLILSRCRHDGCSREGTKGGRCWSHYRRNPPSLPMCLRCRRSFEEAPARLGAVCGLCAPCYWTEYRDGNTGKWSTAARVLREGKAGTMTRLVRELGIGGASNALQRSREDITAWAKGLKPIPAAVWDACVRSLEAA